MNHILYQIQIKRKPNRQFLTRTQKEKETRNAPKQYTNIDYYRHLVNKQDADWKRHRQTKHIDYS